MITCKFIRLFWVIFGFLLFIPFQFYVEGLYFSYFQIAILVFLTRTYNFNRLLIYIIYVFAIFISISIGINPELTAIINPVLTGAVLVLAQREKVRLEWIKNGIYISAILNFLLLASLFIFKDFGSVFEFFTAREWALDFVPYFGNGLSMMFAIAMLFAYKEKKLFFLVIFFLGGLLTTSRIPIIMMFAFLFLPWLRPSKFKTFFKYLILASLIFLSIIVLTVFFLGVNYDESTGLLARFFMSEDRVDVYSQALNLVYENPFFGLGSTKLEFYEHAHNSYLQIFYKFGIFGAIPWLFLLYYAYFKGLVISDNLPFLFIFLIISFFQIGLLNPNLALALLVYVELFKNSNS